MSRDITEEPEEPEHAFGLIGDTVQWSQFGKRAWFTWGDRCTPASWITFSIIVDRRIEDNELRRIARRVGAGMRHKQTVKLSELLTL